MKNSLVVAGAALALCSPFAWAEEEKAAADKPAANAPAAKSHSTSDRKVATKLAATGSGAAAVGAAKVETRDWAAIDTNKDNLISPDEMQKYLDASWAAQKK